MTVSIISNKKTLGINIPARMGFDYCARQDSALRNVQHYNRTGIKGLRTVGASGTSSYFNSNTLEGQANQYSINKVDFFHDPWGFKRTKL